jgi:hypothetical protein
MAEGRDNAEYPDDIRCPTCNKWFRREDLAPLSKEDIQNSIIVERTAWGHCPICQAKLYP